MLFLLSNYKLILGGIAFVVVSYFIYDYKTTKANYKQLQIDYDKTVDAYEETIKIVEAKTREKAITEEKAKNVQNSITRLNKLKENQNETINSDNYTTINF